MLKNSAWRGSLACFRVRLITSLLVKVAQFAKATEIWSPHDDVVEYFDLQKLPGADQVACNLDVCFARLGFSAYADSGITKVMPHPVLCRM